MIKYVWLLFCCAFLWVASEIIRENVFGTVVRWHLAKDWESYSANISTLNLDVKRRMRTDSEGRSYQDVSYELQVVYKYVVNGSEYINSRVSFTQSIDSTPGQYNSRLYRKLEPLYKAGETTNVYVDPNNPQNSILDRSLDTAGLVVYILFAFCLGGISYASLSTQFALWVRSRPESESTKAWRNVLSISLKIVLLTGCLLCFTLAYSAVRDGDYRGLVALIFPGIVVPVVIEFRLRGSRASSPRKLIYLGILWLALSLPIAYIEATSAPNYGFVSYVIFSISLFGFTILVTGIAKTMSVMRN